MNSLAHYINALFATMLSLASGFGQADAPPLKLGMSIALSGPAQEIGKQLRDGAMLHFEAENLEGGIAGRPIELLVLDDGYEPNRTVLNTKQFIYQDKVDALFGYMGTPTTAAIRPLLEHSKTPLLMPFTGADFLHQIDKYHVFNLRASYQDEAQEHIKYLVSEKNHQHIALLIQADEFGITVEKSLTKALALKELTPSTIARFRRNTSDVEKAFEQINQTNATAVIMIGTYEPLATFIRLAERAKQHLEFTSVSFVSSKELFARVKPEHPIMVTEVVPNPLLCKAMLCEKFRRVVAQKPHLKIDHILFEGYLNALVFSHAVKQCQTQYSVQCLLNKLPWVLEHERDLKMLFELSKQQKKLPVYRSYSS
ncbi:ABC transporter substrate-binding protein [Pseudoalteromonas sp. JBTF-M23]|uniref:ABC transporter substrate-binding protein n=1 Tax=Pseudoalteromonas caenipelagi TaxID=2726988 RepID=A0A849VF06_9GAMM|nr:ABC transporter substrate-binding protein [Pseudoalteromonas caenipelagi]NOU51093.1 ABC transporter substrate-binding protein [Pseudoalteromonas caenipelagi]